MTHLKAEVIVLLAMGTPLILEGKKVAESLFSKLLLDISLLPFVPKIVFIIVGNDGASQTYVKMKGKKSESLGLRHETIVLPEATTEEQLLTQIKTLNENADVNGILVQLPLPKHINKYKVLESILPDKDVDGLHPLNQGLLAIGKPKFLPCTPAGVIEILKFYQIPLVGAKAVVVGRSEIVGKPMTQLLLLENATVTVCHSQTKNLAEETAQADILIAALGKPKFITAPMVKEGAVVIDVGIHRVDDKIVGDVDFESVSSKCRAISPVPGGVGPMTIAMLLKNLIFAAGLAPKK